MPDFLQPYKGRLTPRFYEVRTKMIKFITEVIQPNNKKYAIQRGQEIVLRTEDDESGVQSSRATWGSADLCLISRTPIETWLVHLKRYGIQIVQGPVDRSGATGPIRSVHFRDPDGNLIEIANRRPTRPHDAPPPPGHDPTGS